MSKQSKANEIYKIESGLGMTRQQIISEIVDAIGCSAGYASTLYNNARKASAPSTPKAKKPITVSSETEMLGLVPASKKIEQFDKSNLNMIRAELNKALEETLEKFGLSHKLGGIKYSDDNFHVRLDVNAGSSEDAARNNFNKYCAMYGLKASDFGRQFRTANGSVYTITGIKPNRRKFPISGVSARGARYKFTEGQVAKGLI